MNYNKKRVERIHYLGRELSIVEKGEAKIKLDLSLKKLHLRTCLCDSNTIDSEASDALIKLASDLIKLLSGYKNYIDKIKD